MAVSSWVESVESIDAAISGTNRVESVPLTMNQNYENCVPFYTIRSNNTYWDACLTDCYFSGTTESGVINFERENPRSNVVYVKCYVVEFNPNEIRVQQGTFNCDSTSTNSITLPATLSGTNKAAMTHYWKTSDTSRQADRSLIRGRVINTSTIDFYRHSTTYNANGHWFLFEDLGNNFEVMHFSGSHTGTAYAYFGGGRVIDPLRTFMLGSWATDAINANYPTRYSSRAFFWSDGSLRVDKSDSTYTIYWTAQVIEILDKTKVYTPFGHDEFTFPTPNVLYDRDFTNNIPFSCNLNTSIIASSAMQGIARGTDNAYMINRMLCTAELTSSRIITFRRESGANYSVYPSSHIAIDFAGIEVDIGSNDDPIPEGDEAGQSFVKSVENHRLEYNSRYAAYILNKGQDWKNCAIFASSRSDSGSGSQMSNLMSSVRLLEPGIVYSKRRWPSGNHYIDLSVVEFYPSQVKVQHDTYCMEKASTSNVTISGVDTNKSFIIHRVNSTSYANYSKYAQCRARFTSNTNLELYINGAGTINDVSYFVIEDLQNNFTVAHKTWSWNSGTQMSWKNDEHWGYHNSFPIVSYATDSSDYPQRGFFRAFYENEYCISRSYKIDSTYTIYEHLQAIKFTSNKYRTQNHIASFIGGNSTVNINCDVYPTTHSGALTVFNNMQQSVNRMDSSDANWVQEAFSTVRITDYNVPTIEISKSSGNYNSYGAYVFIDWIGKHWQKEDGYASLRTKSLVQSVQKEFYDSKDKWMIMPLKYGQDVTKCVPFHSFTFGTTNRPYVDTTSIFRYEDPDMFILGTGASPTYTRKHVIYIVEFDEDVKIQHGDARTTGTTVQVTIDEVNLERTFLHFYAKSDYNNAYNRSSATVGHFVDSTTIEFSRQNSEWAIIISWYVVECKERGDASHWRAYRDYSTTYATTNGHLYLDYVPQLAKTMFFSSWKTDNPNYPQRGCYRVYNNQARTIIFNKNDSTYGIYGYNVEVVEFNKEWYNKGFMVASNFIDMTNVSPLERTLYVPPEREFFIPRSMIVNANENNMVRVDSSDTNTFREAGFYYEFIDTTGSGYANSINAYKTIATGAHTYDYYYAVQWPDYNKYYFEGVTKEEGEVVSRELLAYRTSTGELVDTATSVSGTGYFYLETPYYDEHHIVCKDDKAGFDYNHLIYGKIYPTVISGCFAHQAGLTASGVEVGIPQWYVLGA